MGGACSALARHLPHSTARCPLQYAYITRTVHLMVCHLTHPGSRSWNGLWRISYILTGWGTSLIHVIIAYSFFDWLSRNNSSSNSLVHSNTTFDHGTVSLIVLMNTSVPLHSGEELQNCWTKSRSLWRRTFRTWAIENYWYRSWEKSPCRTFTRINFYEILFIQHFPKLCELLNPQIVYG